MKKTLLLAIVLGLIPGFVAAQKRKPLPPPPMAVFAVLNDGKSVEPIAKIQGGKLSELSDGGDDQVTLKKFIGSYYKPSTKYKLVFGGANAGTVMIKSSNPDSECGRNMAEVTVASTKAKLKGMVMALATSAAVKGSGVRRLPTPAERSAAEALVRAEFARQKVGAKNLKYHNLTALDLNSDGEAELVGSFWVEPGPTERALLFFIAAKGADGKYAFGYSSFKTYKNDEVMSGDVKDTDTGVYHELLLDVLDIDGDGKSEVFTYIQSFEGAGFSAYAEKNGKWELIFEGSNYHCGY